MPRKAKSKVPAPVDPDDLINLGENIESVIEEIASVPILTEEQEEVPTPVKKDKAPAPSDSDETDAIEKPEEMERELKSDPLLRKDLKVAMAWLTPLIPFLGLLSGGVTIGKHLWEKQVTDVGDSFANGPFSDEVA